MAAFDKTRCLTNIYYLARQKGIKIGDLEADANVSTGYFSRLNKDDNKTVPSIETLLLVADKLGVSVDALVHRDYSTPTPSERYLLDFLDKLTIRTDEDDSIEWKRTPLAVLQSIDCDRDGYVDHPLFFADYGPLPDGEDGYRIHYSSLFRKAEPMKPCGDGFVLDIGRGSELYLMKVVLADDTSDPDIDFEYELYIHTRSEMKGLCHTNARTVTPGLFDSLLQHLYNSAAESSSHVRLGDDIKGILDSFLAGGTEEYVQVDDDELPF